MMQEMELAAAARDPDNGARLWAESEALASRDTL